MNHHTKYTYEFAPTECMKMPQTDENRTSASTNLKFDVSRSTRRQNFHILKYTKKILPPD